jgi:hypothetical protein
VDSYPRVPFDPVAYTAATSASARRGLMHERGYLDIPSADQAALARTIVRNLDGP